MHVIFLFSHDCWLKRQGPIRPSPSSLSKNQGIEEAQSLGSRRKGQQAPTLRVLGAGFFRKVFYLAFVSIVLYVLWCGSWAMGPGFWGLASRSLILGAGLKIRRKDLDI